MLTNYSCWDPLLVEMNQVGFCVFLLIECILSLLPIWLLHHVQHCLERYIQIYHDIHSNNSYTNHTNFVFSWPSQILYCFQTCPLDAVSWLYTLSNIYQKKNHGSYGFEFHLYETQLFSLGLNSVSDVWIIVNILLHIKTFNIFNILNLNLILVFICFHLI